MAIINCPECGGNVSDKAEKCPDCAFPIRRKETVKTTNVVKVVKEKEGCFLQSLNCGCLVFLVVLGIAVIISLIHMFSKK